MRFNVQPHDYAMNLQAMTKEKLQFLLPVVFTVGPDVNQRGVNARFSNDPEGDFTGAGSDGAPERDPHAHDARREDQGDSLMKYAMLLADSSASTSGKGRNDRQFLENIVKGIIEGETRVLVSSMTMEEIFTEREVFKRRIFRNIKSELDQFGLKIYNANVSALRLSLPR
jgi:flotillin